MAKVKLSGALSPDENRNGLVSVVGRLVASPGSKLLATVVLEVAEIHRIIGDPAEGEEDHDVPVLRVVSVEPCTGSLEPKARALHAEAARDRTGISTLFDGSF